MELIEYAQSILEREAKPLHVKDIAVKVLVFDKSFGNNEEEVAKKITARLSSNISRKDKSSIIFKRISNGKGGYKSGIYGLKKKTAPKPPTPVLNIPTINTFTGKAGEYGVFSELLYWGVQ